MKKRILFACFAAALLAWTSSASALIVYARNQEKFKSEKTGNLNRVTRIKNFNDLEEELENKKFVRNVEKIIIQNRHVDEEQYRSALRQLEEIEDSSKSLRRDLLDARIKSKTYLRERLDPNVLAEHDRKIMDLQKKIRLEEATGKRAQSLRIQLIKTKGEKRKYIEENASVTIIQGHEDEINRIERDLRLASKEKIKLERKLKQAEQNDNFFNDVKQEPYNLTPPTETVAKFPNLRVLTLRNVKFDKDKSFDFLEGHKNLRLLTLHECAPTSQPNSVEHFIKNTDLQRHRNNIPRVVLKSEELQAFGFESDNTVAIPRPTAGLFDKTLSLIKDTGYGLATLLGFVRRAREREIKLGRAMIFKNKPLPPEGWEGEGLNAKVRKVTLRGYKSVTRTRRNAATGESWDETTPPENIDWTLFPGPDNDVRHLTLESCDPGVIEKAIPQFRYLESLLIRKSYVSGNAMDEIERHESLGRLKVEDCTLEYGIEEFWRIKRTTGIEVTVENSSTVSPANL